MARSAEVCDIGRNRVSNSFRFGGAEPKPLFPNLVFTIHADQFVNQQYFHHKIEHLHDYYPPDFFVLFRNGLSLMATSKS